MSSRVLALAVLVAAGIAALWLGAEHLKRGERPWAIEPPIVQRSEPLQEPALPESDRRAAVTNALEAIDAELARPLDPESAVERARLEIELISRDTGFPIPRARLTLARADATRRHETRSVSRKGTGIEGKTMITDEHGRVRYLVEPGHALVLEAPNWRKVWELDALAPNDERTIRVEVPSTYDLVWHARIVDGATGLPIAGAEVETVGISRSSERISDEAGWIDLPLPSWRECSVHATASGYFSVEVVADPAENSLPTARTIELLRPGSLTVRVEDEVGSPAPKTWIVLDGRIQEALGWQHSSSKETDARGSCTFPRLPARVPIRIEVRTGHKRILHVSEDVRLEPGESREILLRLEPGCTLTGVVRDETGGAVPATSVILGCGEPFVSTLTDAAGGFRFDGVPPGDWCLRPEEKVGLASRSVLRFRIEPGERLRTLEFRLDRDLTLAGTVVDPRGNAVSKGTVRCEQAEGDSVFMTQSPLQSDGSFRLGPLAAGSYELRATGHSELHAPSKLSAWEAGLQDVVLRLEPGGVLRVRLLDERGQRIGGHVDLFRDGRWVDAHEGGVPLFAQLEAGVYDIVAHDNVSRAGVLTGAPVLAGAAQEIELQLQSAARVWLELIATSQTRRRARVAWNGRGFADVALTGGDRRRLLVPPGELAVSWQPDRKDAPDEHVDRRTILSSDETLTVVYEARQ